MLMKKIEKEKPFETYLPSLSHIQKMSIERILGLSRSVIYDRNFIEIRLFMLKLCSHTKDHNQPLEYSNIQKRMVDYLPALDLDITNTKVKSIH